MMFITIYRFFSSFFPRAYRKHLINMLSYSGSKSSVEFWLGARTLFSFLLLIIAVMIPLMLQSYLPFLINTLFLFIIGGLSIVFLVHIVSYFILYFKVEERSKHVENILPDFLQLVSSNLRSGMTPYIALRESARPEFGILSDEVKLATAKSLGTESFTHALVHISKTIQSDIVNRTIKLFSTGLSSGASLSKLLDEISRDLSENRSLKKDLANSTKTYTAFILFTIIFGSPLLFAISMHFIDVVNDLQSATTISAQAGAAPANLFAGEIVITTQFLLGVSISMLIVTSLLASILMGVIKEGSHKYGLRYAPSLITASLLVFFLFRIVITRLFA